jgi:hypothetical protein
VRNRQSGFLHDFPAKQNQVQVESTRRARERSLPAALSLDRQEILEHLPRCGIRLGNNRTVEEARLVADAYRRRVVPRGVSEILEAPCQALDGKGEV